jgi:2-oxoglutarate ferredoxin oxidoreductase subunit alpha
MTPVILLSDGFIANGAEPWKLPRTADLPPIEVHFRKDPEGFLPYTRDPDTLARPWAIPGTPGLEHRVGGLEKSDGAGNVSYDPLNHEVMVKLRAEKVERVADDIPPAETAGDPAGKLLIVGWGSTYGAITGAVRRARTAGHRIGHLHLRHLNPMPKNLPEIFARYERILVPEMNMGQLAFVLQGRYLVEVERLDKIQGQPFKESEVLERILSICEVN